MAAALDAMKMRLALFRAAAGIALLAGACSLDPAPAPDRPTLAQPTIAPAEPSIPPSVVTPGADLAPGELPPPQTQIEPAQPTAAPTQPIPRLRQLTTGGCCSGPFWSPDSRQVLFIDRPDPAQPAGLWSIAVEDAAAAPGAPQWATDRLGIFSADLQLRAFPEGGETLVERLLDGQRWRIRNGGRRGDVFTGREPAGLDSWAVRPAVRFQPNAQIWISRVDGSGSRQIAIVTGGGFSGWLSEERLLVIGRPAGSTDTQKLWIVDIPEEGSPPGEPAELASAERLRGVVISPGGGWVAYLVSILAGPGPKRAVAGEHRQRRNSQSGIVRRLPLAQ